MVMATRLLTFELSIRQDDAGRYCLNDLHRAAGGASRHQPAFFIRRPDTIELIVAISNSEPAKNKPMESAADRYGGTFVVRELVLAYAMWVSAEFSLKVIRTFDAVTNGATAPALPNFADPIAAARAWADAEEGKRAALASLVSSLPAGLSRHMDRRRKNTPKLA